MNFNFLTRKKTIIYLFVISIVMLGLILVINPMLIKAVMAKYKSTNHFLVLESDPRILYEQGSKNNALIVNKILDQRLTTVEEILGYSTMLTPSVYICNTQSSFNEYVYLSENVRGAVFWGKLFLSPRAFSQGSITRLLDHELTHHLFNSYLGEKSHIENIPLWFREGIAVYVANGGESFTRNKRLFYLMNKDEISAVLNKEVERWFQTSNPSAAVKKGVVNRSLYRISAMVVHFMQIKNPAQFNLLMQALISGKKFNVAVQESYGADFEELYDEFYAYLKNNVS